MRVLVVALARVLGAAVGGLLLCAVAPLGLGWHSSVVVGGSMRPAVEVGDVVVARPAASTPAPGTVVVVRDGVHGHRTLVHRVVAVTSDGSLVTRGDDNVRADSTPIDRDAVIGVATLRIPWIGLPAVWFGQRATPLPVLLATLVAVLGLAARRVRARRPAVGAARRRYRICGGRATGRQQLRSDGTGGRRTP